MNQTTQIFIIIAACIYSVCMIISTFSLINYLRIRSSKTNHRLDNISDQTNEIIFLLKSKPVRKARKVKTELFNDQKSASHENK